MKVIDIGDAVIFIDNIIEIYEGNHGNYFINTKNGRYLVNKYIYEYVREQLKSLNNEIEDTPKEDKKIEKLDIGTIVDDELQGLIKSINVCNKELKDKINEIIEVINGR